MNQKKPPHNPKAAKPRIDSLEPPEIDDTREFLRQMHERTRDNPGTGPALSGGDVDSDWRAAESSGEETAGGSVATPDQDIVEEIGRAIGVTYQDAEPLRCGEKEAERDQHRWELDPASSEDYRDRVLEEERPNGPADPVLHMTHEGHRPNHKKR